MFLSVSYFRPYGKKSQETIKNLTNSDLNNRSDELEKRKENVSICMIKELFTETFKMEEEIIRRIIFSCITNTIA